MSETVAKAGRREALAELKAERKELLALCNQLRPEEWETESLCEGWKVRDVVAHVTGAQTDPLTYFTTPPSKANEKIVEKRRRFSINALLAELATVTEPAGLSKLAPLLMLHDNWVHQQDIRWVLGPDRQRQTDPQRIRLILDLLKKPTDRKKLGILFKATDSDWQAGDLTGSEVRGTGEDLIMLLTRRPAALKRVSGPGVAVLAERWHVPTT